MSTSNTTTTIFYKFRSSPNFETLQLPSSSSTLTRVKLFDIKRAIVQAKHLDKSSGLDFDLVLRNSATNTEYTENMSGTAAAAGENVIDVRGIRFVVQRMPASRGCGLLARMARLEKGMEEQQSVVDNGVNVNLSGFYTLQNEAEEEFVDVGVAVNQEEAEELAAVQAVTDSANLFRPGAATNKTWSAATGSSSGGPVALPSSQQQQQQQRMHLHARPARTTDPELREREQQAQQQAKKRATGIPRTFIAAMGGTGEDEANAANSSSASAAATYGFNSLLTQKGGGQTPAQMLQHALTLTNKEIPSHLSCSICQKLAHTAMFLPWDPEGRTACEECIRPKLLESGYTCPVSGVEGVSPEDLRANVGLRKAVDGFVQEVLKLYGEVIADSNEAVSGASGNEGKEAEVEEMKDVVKVEGKLGVLHKQQQQQVLDPFDSFGGDVFEVAAKESGTEVKVEPEVEPESEIKAEVAMSSEVEQKQLKKIETKSETPIENDTKEKAGADSITKPTTKPNMAVEHSMDDTVLAPELAEKVVTKPSHANIGVKESGRQTSAITSTVTQPPPRTRRPPRGYAMGPAAPSTSSTPTVSPAKFRTSERASPVLTASNTAAAGPKRNRYTLDDDEASHSSTQQQKSSRPTSSSSRSASYRDVGNHTSYKYNNKRNRSDEQANVGKEYVVSLNDPSSSYTNGRGRGYYRDQNQQYQRHSDSSSSYHHRGSGRGGRGPYPGGDSGNRGGGRIGRSDRGGGAPPRYPPPAQAYNYNRGPPPPQPQQGYNTNYSRQQPNNSSQDYYRGGMRGRGRGRGGRY